MSRFFRVVALVALLVSPQIAGAEHVRFSVPVDAADTLPEGAGEIGLFQPLRYGITDSLAVIGHPLVSLVAPAVDFKVRWARAGGWTLSSVSGISFPTGLLSILACEGTGCIYPADAELPFLVGFKTSLFASLSLVEDLRWTLRLGTKGAIALGKNTLPSLDLPLTHVRFAHFRGKSAVWAGMGLDGRIWGPLWFTFDVNGWWVSEDEAQLAVEQTGTVLWAVSEGFALQAGWILVWAQYPYGDDWHILPMVDLLWAFGG